jgi:SAM-dependent methyltransferase
LSGFTYRVCVDLSFVALTEARRRLGSRGIYILADIADLPFQDGALDAVVSLHTVYHVPPDEQSAAVGELVRVTRPGGKAVVVYSAGDACLLMKLPLMRFKALRPLQRRLSWYVRRVGERFRGRSARTEEQAGAAAPKVFFHAHSLAWWRAQLRGVDHELHCWRSVHTDFMKLYIHRCTGGGAILAALAWLEARFPRLLGTIGQYPMFVIDKR